MNLRHSHKLKIFNCSKKKEKKLVGRGALQSIVWWGPSGAEGHSSSPATESWLALEERAGSSARPSGGLHTHSHIIWSYPHYLSCLFSALQSSVNLHSVAHFVLPPSNIIWGSTSPTCLCTFLFQSSTVPSNHPHPFKQGFNGWPVFFTLMLGIRASVVSWRQELTGASREQPINTAQYDCSKDLLH